MCVYMYTCAFRASRTISTSFHGNGLFVLLSVPRQFLRLIRRENLPNKCALAEMQCDGQYCLTEMENSFVGQVICRNCGFRVSFSSPFFLIRDDPLSFSLRAHLPFQSPLYLILYKLNRATTNRTIKIWS